MPLTLSPLSVSFCLSLCLLHACLICILRKGISPVFFLYPIPHAFPGTTSHSFPPWGAILSPLLDHMTLLSVAWLWYGQTNKAVQFSCSFVSNSLWPHGLQHLRPPYPSPTPGTCSNSCPSSWWCHPTFSSSVIPFSSCLLSSVFPRIMVFSRESVLCIGWPNYWSFSFSISPSNEYSGLISFRVEWLNLLAVQGTLKSLLQHDSSKTSFLWHSAFFIVQLSHPYMTTGKIIALTKHTFVGQVMSLLFNMAVPQAYFTILSSERFGKGHVIQIRVTPRPSTGHMEKECFLLWLTRLQQRKVGWAWSWPRRKKSKKQIWTNLGYNFASWASPGSAAIDPPNLQCIFLLGHRNSVSSYE